MADILAKLARRREPVALGDRSRTATLQQRPITSEWKLTTSLYEHAGGEESLHRLEEVFYAKVLADPVLRRLFPERRPHHVEHLTWFTAESFGGPDRFSRELGFAHLIDVHRHLEITDEERTRFAELYMEALDEAGLPDDEPFRGAVRSHIEFGTRVAQRNSHAKTDADLHPLRNVPRWSWPGEGDE
jgi:hemoglobin